MDKTLKLALQLIEVMKYRIEQNEIPSGMRDFTLEVLKEYDRAVCDKRDPEIIEALNTLGDRSLWLETFDEINNQE